MNKPTQKFKTANTLVIDEKVFVNATHLSTEHKIGSTTIQKQIATVNELWQIEAIKIGNCIFYNKKEADIVVNTFKRDYEALKQAAYETLVSTFEK